MNNVVGLKELRYQMDKYIKRVNDGESFLVFRRSKPLFRIMPVEEDEWEEVIDFTKIRKGGVRIEEILTRL